MENAEKKRNLTIAPIWKTRYGNVMTIKLDAVHVDALQAVEKGGKLTIRFLKEESRRDPEKSPHGYLEYISKEDVADFEGSMKKERKTFSDDI